MRTLHEILQDQVRLLTTRHSEIANRDVLESEWDEIPERIITTNPQTLRDLGTLEGWEF